jgi:tetratricopeptide (TPR) repeat protein
MDMYQTAHGIQIKALGKGHVSVGDTYNNMAVVLDAQGKYDEAMKMYQTALGIKIKALGKGHADVGGTYYNMAIVLQAQGKYDRTRLFGYWLLPRKRNWLLVTALKIEIGYGYSRGARVF